MPVASNESLILDAEFNDFTSFPHMPMTVAILVRCIQVDQELSFTHMGLLVNNTAKPIILRFPNNTKC
jgi:hypothetical protein